LGVDPRAPRRRGSRADDHDGQLGRTAVVARLGRSGTRRRAGRRRRLAVAGAGWNRTSTGGTESSSKCPSSSRGRARALRGGLGEVRRVRRERRPAVESGERASAPAPHWSPLSHRNGSSHDGPAARPRSPAPACSVGGGKPGRNASTASHGRIRQLVRAEKVVVASRKHCHDNGSRGKSKPPSRPPKRIGRPDGGERPAERDAETPSRHRPGRRAVRRADPIRRGWGGHLTAQSAEVGARRGSEGRSKGAELGVDSPGPTWLERHPVRPGQLGPTGGLCRQFAASTRTWEVDVIKTLSEPAEAS